ncbi:hypothetical protein, partial [Roseateles aquatilis]|uniref:hypothetical protein n=1 Tax=Roseateles aquatilis TaxID=431061 RepID=UPI001EE0A82C
MRALVVSKQGLAAMLCEGRSPLKNCCRGSCEPFFYCATVTVFAAQTSVLQRSLEELLGMSGDEPGLARFSFGGEILAVDDEINFADCLTDSKEIVHNLASAL